MIRDGSEDEPMTPAARPKLACLALILFLIPFFPSLCLGGTWLVFGPVGFANRAGGRRANRPAGFTRSFGVQNTDVQYTLHLTNGGSGSAGKASNATVLLNGVAVVGPSDLNAASVDKPVTLLASNVLAVELPDANSAISLQITGIDNDPPIITSKVSPAPNAAGWNNTSVTVSFECSDKTSGIDTCPSPVTVSSEGANIATTGTATDKAGNTAAAAVNINLDLTAPSVAVTSPANGSTAAAGNPITVNGTISDALSGIAGVTCNGSPASVSGSSFVCSVLSSSSSTSVAVQVTDVAGNVSSTNLTVNAPPPPPPPPVQGPPPTPAVTSVTPSVGPAGQQSLAVTINGQATNWVQGTTVASFGDGVSVSSLTVNTMTSASALLDVSPLAVPGIRTVTMTTGTEVATLANTFRVSALTSTSPPTAPQGTQNFAVTITGLFTNWLQGTTTASFGAGITVASLNVLSPTSATATLNVDVAAATGVRTVTMTTGAVVDLLNSGFTVAPITPLLLSVTPNTGQQAQQNLSIALTGQFTNWVQGQTIASFGSGIGIVSLTVNSPTTATAVVNIDPAAFPGTRTVSLTNGSESPTAIFTDGFTVTAVTPTLPSVSPPAGQQGQQNLSVAITGQFTNWFQGTTTASLGAGITVVSLTVNSPVTATAVVNIDAAAAAGARTVTMTTGSQIISLPNGFTVTPGTPVVQTLSITSGQQGQQNLSVAITGQFTHWVQGTTTANFGAGITLASVTVSSPTAATAVVNIDPAAALGARTATLTTGAEIASLANGFNVIVSPGPQITITSPANLTTTNLSPVTVNGTINDPAATININGVTTPQSSGTFSVAIPLVEGLNTLTAVARNQAGVTNTATVQVTLDTTPPHITIESPADGTSTTATSATITGTANDVVVGTVNSLDVQVTVNGVTATVANRTYSSLSVPLTIGANSIQATGRDRAGNGTTASITITRVAPGSAPAPTIGQSVVNDSLSIVSGNNQTGTIGTQLAAPLIVVLLDSLSHPVPNQTVVFKVTGSDGTVNVGGAGATAVNVTTDANGQAKVFWTLGQRSGAGINTVQVSSPVAFGQENFSATALPSTASKINVDSGNNQTGAVSQPLPFPFVAVVTDSGFNRVPNVPVTFTVQPGGGNLGGVLTKTVNTDSNGRAIVVLTLGPQEGNGNNVVVADFPGNPGLPATFTASAVAPANPANTTISGVVLDNSNTPIQGVTIRLFQANQANNNNLPVPIGTPVVTNAQGTFLISSAPVGSFKLMADGTTALGTKSYPTLEYDIVTIAGQNNTVGSPIFLPALDIVTKLCVDATHGGTLTLPQSPGFSLTVLPGSATFPGGTKTGCVTVTPVNGDKVPMVPGFGQQPRYIVTIQPVGTLFNPPAPITLPNVDGLTPSSITEMYSYDHDLGMFIAIGTGTVSADGSVIASNPGVGVLKAGWHCGGNPNAAGGAENVVVQASKALVNLAVGQKVDVLASGGPKPIGTPAYTWAPADGAVVATPYATGTDSQTDANRSTFTGVGPGETTVTVRYQCESGASATTTVKVRVCSVNSVVFEAIDSPIDANPNAGGGLRFFPEKISAADKVNRNKVRVKATVTPAVAGITVYFKSFDVDDPSSNDPLLDANAAAGDDNRANPKVGQLSAASAVTDASGVATVEFTSIGQPGDNYKVIATCNSDYLAGLTVDSLNVKDSDGAPLPTAKGKITDMLTVWRRVHVEIDSMGPVTGNSVSGNITGLVPTTSGTATLVDVDNSLDDGSDNLDQGMCGDPPTPCLGAIGKGRFEHGTLTAGPNVIANLDANGNFKVTRAAGLNITANPLPFAAIDNDSFGNSTMSGTVTSIFQANSHWVLRLSVAAHSETPIDWPDFVGGTISVLGGPAMPIVDSSAATSTLEIGLGSLRIPYSMIDDDKIKDTPHTPDTSMLVAAFAPAYVLPVFDLAGGQNNVPFVLNITPDGTKDVYRFDNIATEADVDFWTVYLLGTYQPETNEDGDPDDEGATLGIVDKINGVGAKVFEEDLKEITPTAVKNEAATTAHEIGHLFNGMHVDCDIAAVPAVDAAHPAQPASGCGLMAQTTTRTSAAFSLKSLNKIRSVAHP